jgi:hypothetical protein
MRRQDIMEIAKTWWIGVKQDDGEQTERLDRFVKSHPEDIPDLLAALVQTAPAEGPHYVGTSILEDLHDDFEFHGAPNLAFEYLLRAHLTSEEMTAVLSGVYPELLEEWDIHERMNPALTNEQIAWLTNRDAPRRGDYL